MVVDETADLDGWRGITTEVLTNIICTDEKVMAGEKIRSVDGTY